jgi:glutathione S-transferase
MPAKLYTVYGSHPCNTIEKALQLKGIGYTTVEIPPPGQIPLMKMMFGERTVPAIKLEDGTKVQGSRAIMATLEELVPEPALLPADPAAARAVLDAEQWGDDVLQGMARRILWTTLKADASPAPSFSEGGKLKLPAAVLRASMPFIARVEMRINDAGAGSLEDDLKALPGHLDKIDTWIEEGVMGGAEPNRADLQIAPTLRLMMTLEDLRAVIAPRPCGELALRYYPDVAGSIPSGALPAPLLASFA